MMMMQQQQQVDIELAMGALTRSLAAGDTQSQLIAPPPIAIARDAYGGGSSNSCSSSASRSLASSAAAPSSNANCITAAAPGRYGTAAAPAAGSTHQNIAEQQLKCPRCDSRNTKFCYYNNYSFTQPRHFCKNCRRYWTEGGALRNVPVGGGCRKNKRSAVAMGGSSKLHIRSAEDHPHGTGLQGLLQPASLLSNQSTSGSIFASLSSKLIPPFLHLPPSAGTTDAAASSMANSSSDVVDTAAAAAATHALLFNDLHFPALIHKRPHDLNVDAGAADLNQLLQQPPLQQLMVDTRYPNSATYMDQLCYFLEHPSAMAGASAAPVLMNLANSATATLASIEDQLSSFSSIHGQPFSNQELQADHVNTNTCPAEKTTHDQDIINDTKMAMASTIDGSGASIPPPESTCTAAAAAINLELQQDVPNESALAIDVCAPHPSSTNYSKEQGSCCFEAEASCNIGDGGSTWSVARAPAHTQSQQQPEEEEAPRPRAAAIHMHHRHHHIDNMFNADEKQHPNNNVSATSSWAASRWTASLASTAGGLVL